MFSVISALLLVCMGAFSLYIIIKCKDVKWVKAALAASLGMCILAVLGGVCVTVGCMEEVSKLAEGSVENARSAYFAFMLAAGVFTLIILAISLFASLMRHRLVLVRTLVAYLGALADVAVLSPLFCMLFNLFGVDIDIYVEILALCLGVLCTAAVTPDIYRLMKQLSCPEGIAEREKALRPRRRKRRR